MQQCDSMDHEHSDWGQGLSPDHPRLARDDNLPPTPKPKPGHLIHAAHELQGNWLPAIKPTQAGAMSAGSAQQLRSE